MGNTTIMRCLPAIAVALVASFGTADAATGPLFASPFLSYPMGQSVTRVRLADLNHDGALDLVASDEASDAIWVRLGKGDGTFGIETRWAVGRDPQTVTVGDLDGDGNPDLVSVNTYSRTVSILRGHGDGTFSNRSDLAVPRGALEAAIADLNGDQIPDLVLADQDSGSVSVWLGQGGGSFSSPRAFRTPGEPVQVAVGDFNGDAKPDLAVLTMGGGLAVLPGLGDGTFANRQVLPFRGTPGSIETADLNGDGIMDLVAGATSPVSVSVFWGSRTGILGIGPVTSVDRSSSVFLSGGGRIALGDLDRDGIADLVVAGIPNPTAPLEVLRGLGQGRFGSPVAYAAQLAGGNVVIGDLNGDGRLDVVSAGDDAVDLLLGNGDGSLGESCTTFPAPGSGAVTTGDLNGDGNPDIVTTDLYDGTVNVLLGHGDGTFSAGHPFSAGGHPVAVAIGDMDHDGIPDIVVSNDLGFRLLLGNGDGSFRQSLDSWTETGPLQLADLDGDGDPDVAAPNWWSGTTCVVLTNGRGGMKSRWNFWTGGKPTLCAIADVNGDRLPDLVVSGGDVDSVAVLLNQGAGWFGPPMAFAAGHDVVGVAVADVNHDGLPDIVCGNHDDLSISVLPGRGDGTFGPQHPIAMNDHPRELALVDLDGDGNPDVIVLGDAGVSVFLGAGDGTFGAPLSYGGAGANAFAIGDVNHDGRPDLVITGGAGVAVMLNVGPAGWTGAQRSQFLADWNGRSVILRFQPANGSSFTGYRVRRSVSRQGPWSSISGDSTIAGTEVRWSDPTAAGDRAYYYRVETVGPAGHPFTFGPIYVPTSNAAAQVALSPIFPNPSRSTVRFTFTLVADADVNVSLFDLQGRRMDVLAHGHYSAGYHHLKWDPPTGNFSGLCFVRLETNGISRIQKFTVMR